MQDTIGNQSLENELVCFEEDEKDEDLEVSRTDKAALKRKLKFVSIPHSVLEISNSSQIEFAACGDFNSYAVISI